MQCHWQLQWRGGTAVVTEPRRCAIHAHIFRPARASTATGRNSKVHFLYEINQRPLSTGESTRGRNFAAFIHSSASIALALERPMRRSVIEIRRAVTDGTQWRATSALFPSRVRIERRGRGRRSRGSRPIER